MIRAGKGKHGQVVVLTLTVHMVFSLLTDVAVPAFKCNAIYSFEVVFLLGLVEDKSASLLSMTFPAQQFQKHKKVENISSSKMSRKEMIHHK